MAPLPSWLTNAPAWMVEQWRTMPRLQDERAVMQSDRALLEALRQDRHFSWVEVADAA